LLKANTLPFLFTAAVAGLALSTVSAPARAAEGPWCALPNMGSDLSEDCQYQTLEQCLPATSA